MPDITMCMNETCPKATTCRRSKKSGTVESEYQYIALFKPNADGECKHYLGKVK